MSDSAWKDFLAGYVSGLAGLAIGNPLDIIKVRLQERSLERPHSQAEGRAIVSATSGVQALYREGGISRLFLGVTAPVFGLAFLNGILFTSYGYLLKVQKANGDGRNELSAVFLAGAGAGLASVFVTNPVELIKCREQGTRLTFSTSAVTNARPSTLSLVKSIYAAEGLRGFYVATLTTAARDAIGYGFYFAGYEATRQYLASTGGDGHPWLSNDNSIAAAGKILIAGGIGGVISWSSVYPLDSVKTILQSSSRDNRPSSAWSATKDIWRSSGLRAFYRGLWPTVVRALLVNGVTFFAYESVIQALTPAPKAT